MNTFLMGEGIHGAAMHVPLSSQLVSGSISGEKSVHNDLAGGIWTGANNWKNEFTLRELLNVFSSRVSNATCTEKTFINFNLCQKTLIVPFHKQTAKAPIKEILLVSLWCLDFSGNKFRVILLAAPPCCFAESCMLRQDFRWPLMTL